MSNDNQPRPKFNVTNINSFKRDAPKKRGLARRDENDLRRDLSKYLKGNNYINEEFINWYIDSYCFSKGGEVRDFNIEKKVRASYLDRFHI